MKFIKVFNMFMLLSVSAVIFTGCSEERFKVNGEIEGGADKTVVLEKSDFHGRWIAVDSTKVASSGKFEIKSASPASPEIYRLSLDGKFIYFPVDSVETVSIVSPADRFGTDFEVSGSEQAVNMASFEKELMALDASDEAKREEFKKNVYSKYLKESRGNIIGYYVLTKIIDGKPLYDPENSSDARYYAAVATGFEQFRPNDPHTGMLRDVSIAGMRRKNAEKGKTRVLEAEEITLLDIDLQNEDGKNVKLSDIAGKGKKTVVIFSMMNQPESPAINLALSDLYNSFGGNVEFYQVSFDSDHYAWRDAAKNIKWVTVIDPAGMTSD
ncbi:MAG: DUF4369 domain-containing protein, partial [Muribaculaceae bacterium]|nr:DUF4369 domain-containing protein [Muribaculaceae bacterium]